MASLADFGAFDGLFPIFVFLLVFAIVYGILTTTKVFGDSKNIQAIIALVIGIIVAITPRMGEVFKTMIPWYAWMFVFIMVLIMAIKFFGADDDMFRTFMTENRTVQTWLIIIFIVILIASVGKVYFSPSEDSNSEPDVTVNTTDGVITRGDVDEQGEGAFWATIFNPKVLGFIMVMMIGVFTVLQLSGPVKK